MKKEKGEIAEPKKLVMATLNVPTTWGSEVAQRKFFSNKTDAIKFVNKTWVKELKKDGEEEEFIQIVNVADGKELAFWKVEEDVDRFGKTKLVRHF